MESQPRISSAEFSSFSHSEHRFIHNKGKPEANSISFSVPRSFSMGMRCDSCRLDRNVCICFSSPVLIAKILRKVEQESSVFLLIAPFSPRQSGCYRSTRDAYSSQAPDPTSIFLKVCVALL